MVTSVVTMKTGQIVCYKTGQIISSLQLAPFPVDREDVRRYSLFPKPPERDG